VAERDLETMLSELERLAEQQQRQTAAIRARIAELETGG
jgi:hypothetical protein